MKARGSTIGWSMALLATMLAAPAAARGDQTDNRPAEHSPATPIHQLRVYEMVDASKAAFHRRFRDQALRIMDRHGFDIVATWESPTDRGTEFVYLLQWPDQATMEAQWEAFLADEEWIAIKRQSRETLPQPIMGEVLQDKTLLPTDYSPQRSFDDED